MPGTTSLGSGVSWWPAEVTDVLLIHSLRPPALVRFWIWIDKVGEGGEID
jgi:hypothetical protein